MKARRQEDFLKFELAEEGKMVGGGAFTT
ncbi:uncharacterized protein G2W53_013217 [Senna tora]|uniref:Uncharacterized protein n=1 Tax=Senna tora TaxID=362788 RepID=A0A834WSQ4_9FABA|nr:uncharacterized protein G2W53_013217 [Senna tora]